MQQFTIKTTVFSDYGLAAALFEQLKYKKGWRFPENVANVLTYLLPKGVKDDENGTYGSLYLRFTLQVNTHGVTGHQFGTYTTQIYYNGRVISTMPVGSEWIKEKVTFELEAALRKL